MGATIGTKFETNHAFSIKLDNGIELFVHFGIDKIELKGEGIHSLSSEGQKVQKGNLVFELVLSLLKKKQNRY